MSEIKNKKLASYKFKLGQKIYFICGEFVEYGIIMGVLLKGASVKSPTLQYMVTNINNLPVNRIRKIALTKYSMQDINLCYEELIFTKKSLAYRALHNNFPKKIQYRADLFGDYYRSL
jgi:hypothetical protein